jgi:dTMP kinase
MQNKKGKLIAIEGTDGSGKNTQSEKLRERLWNEGISCGFFSFPRYESPTGQIITNYLKGEFGSPNKVNPNLVSTLYALDRQPTAKVIRGHINSGTPVICDRYVWSNMAHQGGKIKDSSKRKKFIDWLEELEYGDFGMPIPDITIFLYVPNKIAEELRRNRGKKLDGHEKNKRHLSNAENVYLELANSYENWHKIDCASNGAKDSLRTIEDIGDEVYQIVKNSLQNT